MQMAETIPMFDEVAFQMEIEVLIEKANNLHPSFFTTTTAVSRLFTQMYRNEIMMGRWPDCEFMARVFNLGKKIRRELEKEESAKSKKVKPQAPLLLTDSEWDLLVQMKLKEFHRREVLETHLWQSHKEQRKRRRGS
ncbi:hypothetical protein E0198_004841 [Clavispora lusitaniae]|nr:hypothetical protein E0198_004841 [Clavispora lusitaniae]